MKRRLEARKQGSVMNSSAHHEERRAVYTNKARSRITLGNRQHDHSDPCHKVKLPPLLKFMDIALPEQDWFLRGMHNGSTSIALSIPHLASRRSFYRTPISQTPTAEDGILFLPRLISCSWMEAMPVDENKGEEGEPSSRKTSELGSLTSSPTTRSGSVRRSSRRTSTLACFKSGARNKMR
ncbi:unnamed protein product [Microthlaspi erraticum]|uniref:Uncharacterized protein n=1 Tax=Microthlaspi erraticum TaxID=1685480 RepID=A0A6D2HIK5_9BRAS|nr:unnamed protein product [Microthlaspi erraticum]